MLDPRADLGDDGKVTPAADNLRELSGSGAPTSSGHVLMPYRGTR
ncbi:MAG: hypothetical protein M0T79_15355 [Actinomycetota bacterium]|nr:hypothetical protein [Actinomycetota bacterium]